MKTIEKEIKGILARTKCEMPEEIEPPRPKPPPWPQRVDELISAGYPRRAALKVNDMHGPGLARAKQLEPRVKKDSMILLLGERGPGKTQMAAYFASFRRKNKLSVGKYVKALDLFDALKSTWATRESEDSVLRGYKTSRFLVIDEIHERAESEWEQRKLNNLIDHRYDAMLVTVMCGNLTEAAAKKQLGPTIWSRLKETGGVVVCDWPSYR